MYIYIYNQLVTVAVHHTVGVYARFSHQPRPPPPDVEAARRAVGCPYKRWRY